MIITAPSSLPPLISPIPFEKPVGDYVLDINLAKAKGPGRPGKRPPFVDAATNESWTPDVIESHVAQLTAALSSEWQLDSSKRWDGVVALLSTNTVWALFVSWAVHRLGGACLMLQPTSSPQEIAAALQRMQPSAVFMSPELLPLGNAAMQVVALPTGTRVYDLSIESRVSNGVNGSDPKTRNLRELIDMFGHNPAVPPHPLSIFEASQRPAYYCTTSGTSGYQRLVAITHRHMIAGIEQWGAIYAATRGDGAEVALGFLPFNHIFGLMLTHTALYLGASLIIHRGFDLLKILVSIGKYQIDTLYLVPPIINALSRNAALLDKFDLSSVRIVASGGGPLSKEALLKMQAVRPGWTILSGWGQTETCGIGTLSTPEDVFPGSSGILLPGVKMRLKDENGREVEGLNEMGEMEIASPSVLPGYVDNDESTKLELTHNGQEFWWPTGDVGEFRMGPNGQVHLFVVDRIRDMIKVKGIQVAPGQIEAHLTQHSAVAEVAVIGVPDEASGERPMAFIVLEPTYAAGRPDGEVQQAIREHNDSNLPEVCRLQDRIALVDQLPKSASGKVLKRELRKLVAT